MKTTDQGPWPVSRAQPTSIKFAETSVPNKSVHVSLQTKSGEKSLNFRFPASQLTGFIENLQRVKEVLDDEGIDTGRARDLIPAAPWGFFDDIPAATDSGQTRTT